MSVSPRSRLLGLVSRAMLVMTALLALPSALDGIVIVNMPQPSRIEAAEPNPDNNSVGWQGAHSLGDVTASSPVAAVGKPQHHSSDELPIVSLQPERWRPTVGSWHYQLQNIDVAVLSNLDTDLIVIDHAEATGEGPPVEFSRSEIEALKTRPNGGRRIVLAYLSIGEAEEYRFYWKSTFAKSRPKWLAGANREWPDNHRVRFWMDEWKAILLRGPGSYLDRILDAGFDGVYLDRLDVHASFASEKKDARDQMLKLVKELIGRSRTITRDFLVVAQNAEELLDDIEYRSMIDGIAKEDYIFGAEGEAKGNTGELVHWSTEKLRLLQRDGKMVLVVEYLIDPLKQSIARAHIDREGFIPIFMPRALDGSGLEQATKARNRLTVVENGLGLPR